MVATRDLLISLCSNTNNSNHPISVGINQSNSSFFPTECSSTTNNSFLRNSSNGNKLKDFSSSREASFRLRNEGDALRQVLAFGSPNLDERFMEGSGDRHMCVTNASCFPLRTMTPLPSGIPRNTFDPYPEKNCGQMTIFYAGEVSVYDDVPISKAQEIIDMAIDENRWPKKVSKPLAVMDPFATKTLRKEENSKHNVLLNGHIDNHYVGDVKVSESSTQVNIKHETECLAPKPTRPCASSSPRSKMVLEGTLPHARKASLVRFFERRNSMRMQIMHPYRRSNASLRKPGIRANPKLLYPNTMLISLRPNMML